MLHISSDGCILCCGRPLTDGGDDNFVCETCKTMYAAAELWDFVNNVIAKLTRVLESLV